MKNTTDLRGELISAFADLKARKIDVTAAKAMIGLGNSILKTATAEADYNKFLGKKTEIEFLKTPETKPSKK